MDGKKETSEILFLVLIFVKSEKEKTRKEGRKQGRKQGRKETNTDIDTDISKYNLKKK